MNKEFEMVKLFHQTFKHPVGHIPQMMDVERAGKRYNWMQEEIDEFLQADTIYDQADAMIDLMYFALGTLVEMGVQPDTIFSIVQEANMAKVFPSDGQPHWNEEGKVVKPDGWQPPEPKIKAEIDKAYVQGSYENA